MKYRLLFGILATEVAYTHGEEWLEQALTYIQGNLDFLTDFIERNIPVINVIQPEGTYLVWLDCRGLDIRVPLHRRNSYRKILSYPLHVCANQFSLIIFLLPFLSIHPHYQ